MSKLEELKQLKLGALSLDQMLKAKHSRGEWREDQDVLIFAESVQGRPTMSVEYRWKYDEQGFEAINGKALEITPQFDRVQHELTQESYRLVPFDQNVHDYWNKLFADNDNEEEATQKVAERFEINVDEVTEIYVRVQKFLHG